MADYNDYLNYLHHIDDTTAQEFKKREDELRHQIDVIRELCRKEIRDIQDRTTAERALLEADHKSAVEALTSKYQLSIDKLTAELKQLEETYKAELRRANAEKDTAVARLKDGLAQIEEQKSLAVEQAVNKNEAEHRIAMDAQSSQYKSSIVELTDEIKELKESHKVELQNVITEKDALISKLTSDLAKIESKKFSIGRIAAKIKAFLFKPACISTADGEKETLKEDEKASEGAVEIHFCRKCGKALKPDAMFCNKCGTKINR